MGPGPRRNRAKKAKNPPIHTDSKKPFYPLCPLRPIHAVHHLLALTGENVLLATSLLWLNAAGFVFLANRPWWALGQAVLYVLALVFLSRKLLLSGTPG